MESVTAAATLGRNPARQNISRGGVTSVFMGSHKYEAIPSFEDEYPARELRYSTDIPENHHVLLEEHLKQPQRKFNRRLIMTGIIALGSVLIYFLVIFVHASPTPQTCDTVDQGYVCNTRVSHTWGQYSPYYEVSSDISTKLSKQCQITFANMLSRHGARNPTDSKTAKYEALVKRIHTKATSYGREYAFIKDYNYTLGANDLTTFGQQQMVNSGIKFYERYQTLAREITPFVRSSGSDRVVESALNWTQGFHATRLQDSKANSNDGYPYPIVTVSENAGSNNTLNHGLCTDFEDGYESKIADSAQATWASIFTPDITARLNKNLPGVNFTITDTIYFMDLCPFNTVANDLGTISPFCDLIRHAEWRDYDYYQSLGKYYGYGWGNPLGATQGVGFTNELIARMTDTAVEDHTSTNSTLDDNPATFPVGAKTPLYADFSHDNDMTAIFSALGLYNSTAPLSNTTIEDTDQTNGYSAAWTVSFAGRAYFEKMSCDGYDEELVRVVVNDRVLPLETCGGDKHGRCKLSSFVKSLSFAREGGDWAQCFI